MADKIFTVAVLVLVFLVVAVSVIMVRRFFRAVRGFRAEPYVPIIDPLEPAPVKLTGWLVAVSCAAVAWSVLHLLLVSIWAMTGRWVAPTVPLILIAAYVTIAATMTGMGGVMLLRRRPYGRRMIAWGEMLFGYGLFMALVVTILLPGVKDVLGEWVAAARIVGFVLAGHVLVDGVIGTAAQYVGKAEAAELPAKPTPAERPPGEGPVSMPEAAFPAGWQDNLP